MKKTFTILGFISALVAVVLSVTHLFKFAITPIIIAFISGIIIISVSKNQDKKPKPIQYIFLLVIISLGLTVYKGVYPEADLNNTEQIEMESSDKIEETKGITDKEK